MTHIGENIVLNVADFSIYPIGRDSSDSDVNGQVFRAEWLKPAFEKAVSNKVKLFVSFRGVLSFGSSFLEEAFGGLVSKEGFPKDLVKKTLVIEVIPGEDRYDGIIRDLIDDAEV